MKGGLPCIIPPDTWVLNKSTPSTSPMCPLTSLAVPMGVYLRALCIQDVNILFVIVHCCLLAAARISKIELGTRLHKSRSSRSELEFDLSNFV